MSLFVAFLTLNTQKTPLQILKPAEVCIINRAFRLINIYKDMQDLVIMQYLGSNVCFTQDGWINATETAQSFGKDIRGYTRSEQYKGYSQALARKLNCVNSAQLQKTIEGRNGGTFLHPKLAVDFARWISPEFAIWCDEVIAEKLNTLPKKSILESLAEGFAQMAKLEKEQHEQAKELKALQASQDATAGKLHEIEAKVNNLNNDYYSLAGYYGLRHQRWNLTQTQAIQTGKKLKKISQELGYGTLSVNDARHGAVNTYHVFVLQTVLGF